MTRRVPIREVGAIVGARDPRTIRRRLEALGIPVLRFAPGGPLVVDVEAVERACAAREGHEEGRTRRGIVLAPGERLGRRRRKPAA